jgi:hypothetical protein
LALPVLVFLVGALIVLLFTLAQSNFQFRPAFVPVEIQGDECEAFALHGACQAVQFAAV